jgi:hypothetical protein
VLVEWRAGEDDPEQMWIEVGDTLLTHLNLRLRPDNRKNEDD